MATKREKVVLKGVCFLHSETGTEGGYWAFQDDRFITKNVVRPYCKKCGLYLDSQEGTLQVSRVLSLDRVLAGEDPSKCKEGEHERDVGDSWSYEGLYILENGDHLTIFSPDNPSQVVWSGTISLKSHKLFSEHASGFWIHHDQEGIDREVWANFFFKEHTAQLIKNRKS
jgi:hypothetical protein